MTASFDYSNFHCFVGFHSKGPSNYATVFLALSHIDGFTATALTLFNVL
jgi:hypothetical protein